LQGYTNNSVHWDTPYGVLHPWVQSELVSHGTSLSPDELPQLLPDLDDPDRFVLAHILLSGSARAGSYALADARPQETTHNEYCGLRVIGPLNAPRYDPSQIPGLREMWLRSLYEPRVEVMWLSLHWLLILLVTPSVAFAIGRAIRRARLARMVGRCRHCLYDLTGNQSGLCPECGNPIPNPSNSPATMATCLGTSSRRLPA
jgi:hypothetical protein